MLNQLLKKWIDFELSINQLNYGFDAKLYGIILDLLNAPTIDPLNALGICQCKDCIHLDYNNENEPYCNHIYGLNEPYETDYCSYAKRKE